MESGVFRRRFRKPPRHMRNVCRIVTNASEEPLPSRSATTGSLFNMRGISTLASDSTTQTGRGGPESDIYGSQTTSMPKNSQNVDARRAILNDAGRDQYNEFNFTCKLLSLTKLLIDHCDLISKRRLSPNARACEYGWFKADWLSGGY